LAAAIVVGLTLTSCGSDDSGGGTDDSAQGSDDSAQGSPIGDAAEDAACFIGVQAVDALAEDLEKKFRAASIIARIGVQVAGDPLCRAAIRTFVKHPNESVDLDIGTQEGGIITQAVTGKALLQSPPPPPSDDLDIERLVACVKWDNKVLFDLCADYEIPPPSGFPNTDEARILSLLDPSVAPECERESADDRYERSVAGVYCTPGDVSVWYDLFPTREALDAMYETRFREKALPDGARADSGSCSHDAVAEGDYTQGGEYAGRLLCYLDDEGSPVYEWKHDELLVLATAKGPGHAALERWWESFGGQCSPCQ
jgi:hypothetical protein